jgi:hypothetical protein
VWVSLPRFPSELWCGKRCPCRVAQGKRLFFLLSPLTLLSILFNFSSLLCSTISPFTPYPHLLPRCSYLTPTLTLSRRTESLLTFSGGAEGFVVMLGGHVKCRTHMGCVSTAVTVFLALLAMRRLCSVESSRSPSALHPCS